MVARRWIFDVDANNVPGVEISFDNQDDILIEFTFYGNLPIFFPGVGRCKGFLADAEAGWRRESLFVIFSEKVNC